MTSVWKQNGKGQRRRKDKRIVNKMLKDGNSKEELPTYLEEQ